MLDANLEINKAAQLVAKNGAWRRELSHSLSLSRLGDLATANFTHCNSVSISVLCPFSYHFRFCTRKLIWLFKRFLKMYMVVYYGSAGYQAGVEDIEKNVELRGWLCEV